MMSFSGAILAHNWPIWWVAQVVAVGILVYLILRWKPGFLKGRTIGTTLGATLDAREEQIRAQLSAAEESRREAALIREQAVTDIENARHTAEQIVSRAQHTSEAIQQEIVARAEEERLRIVGQAKSEIDYERRQAEQALRRRAADIVVDAASQVVGNHMSPSTDRRIIDESLVNLKELR
jgi:F-type H+-transporting ATPase subunit b